jgi:tagatose-1,6-bisphosphate aldolase non-catalytic subunit AgaZ/GatZ
LPTQAAQLRAGTLANAPRAMIRSKIKEVTAIYSQACTTNIRAIPANSNEQKKVGQC